MKHAHKVLQIRHHKHTGKILPHKHTSYGVLFLLMLIPILALVFVGQFVAASNYEISASVPAIAPSTPPTITNPTENAVTPTNTVTVSGTCPVTTPPVIVAIYNNDVLVGSAQCAPDGTYSVTVYLNEGVHRLTAKVISITGDPGGVSAAITVEVRKIQPSRAGGETTTKPVNNIDPLGIPLHIMPKDIFSTLDGSHATTWSGYFQGGTSPYRVTIEWGDGTKDVYEITDNSLQTFSHTYPEAGNYSLKITVTDSVGTTVTLQSTAVTFMLWQKSILDTRYEQASPLVLFIQKHLIQIYILTLSALVFLWYMEHGRKVTWHLMKHGNLFGVQKKAHGGRRHR